MARHRSHSVAFKRQVALEFVAGETLHGLAKRHDLSRNLIRLWVRSTKPAPSTKTQRPPT
jgi:transposase-like protein